MHTAKMLASDNQHAETKTHSQEIHILITIPEVSSFQFFIIATTFCYPNVLEVRGEYKKMRNLQSAQ